MIRRLLLTLWLAALPGCVDADLGQVPLLCNPGVPRCPHGYTCVHFQTRDYCVKEGVDARTLLSGLADGGQPAE
jgi:hypothetical protein